MNYVALHIPVADEPQAEILTAELAEYPFEGFQTQDGLLTACIGQEHLAGCRAGVDALLERYGVAGRCETIADQNWNALWEGGFEPVDVAGRLLIRAPFHDPAPEGVVEVVLTPRMSFGTGHHATTWLLSRALLDRDIAGREGLDMGSGTGVLAIVAAKCGAAHIDAVDCDERADRSCRENIAVNGVAERVTPLLGDARSIACRQYDFILANISRNILTADMPAYAAALRPGGELLMSGFLERDAPAILARAAELGMVRAGVVEKEGWALVCVAKR